MVPSSRLRVIARVHPVHAMNAEQRQTAADPWTTKPTDLSGLGGPKGRRPSDLSHRPAYRLLGNYTSTVVIY